MKLYETTVVVLLLVILALQIYRLVRSKEGYGLYFGDVNTQTGEVSGVTETLPSGETIVLAPSN